LNKRLSKTVCFKSNGTLSAIGQVAALCNALRFFCHCECR